MECKMTIASQQNTWSNSAWCIMQQVIINLHTTTFFNLTPFNQHILELIKKQKMVIPWIHQLCATQCLFRLIYDVCLLMNGICSLYKNFHNCFPFGFKAIKADRCILMRTKSDNIVLISFLNEAPSMNMCDVMRRKELLKMQREISYAFPP